MMLRNLVLIVCASLELLWSGSAPVHAETRRVVLLFDERVELPGLSSMDAEFVRTLQAHAGSSIEVYREPMDLSRFGSETYKAALRDFLRTKYESKKIDVVVAIMAPALDFATKFGGEVFPNSSIVFWGLDRKQIGNGPLPPKQYGVLVKREFAPTLDVALRLHPNARKAVVVSGTSDFDEAILSQVQSEFRAYESRVQITYLSELSFQSLLSTLSNLPPDTIGLFATLFQDGTGAPFVPHEAVEQISSASSVPIYGFLDQYLGRGIVGGSLYSFERHGADAARLVLRVLADDPPSEAISERSSNKVAFDWRQMQRWSISENALPLGAEIRYREPSILERYRFQILIVVGIILTQSALIAALLYERRRAYHAELDARERMSELARVSRFATAGELTASIAHEINQPLGAIRANAETAELMLGSSSLNIDEIREIVADIRKDENRATEVILRLRSFLRKAPFELKELDINDVVRETIAIILSVGQPVDLRSSLAAVSLPIRGDPIQLQQVILNLMMNAIDAMAKLPNSGRKLTVATAREGDFAELSVLDAGPGIAPDKIMEVFEPFFTTKDNGMGMGLPIARTIVEAHGGRIWADNLAIGGAVFRVRLPLAHAGRRLQDVLQHSVR